MDQQTVSTNLSLSLSDLRGRAGEGKVDVMIRRWMAVGCFKKECREGMPGKETYGEEAEESTCRERERERQSSL